jgi:hypothetical protein
VNFGSYLVYSANFEVAENRIVGKLAFAHRTRTTENAEDAEDAEDAKDAEDAVDAQIMGEIEAIQASKPVLGRGKRVKISKMK